jgi:signal transduction histidine kinase
MLIKEMNISAVRRTLLLVFFLAIFTSVAGYAQVVYNVNKGVISIGSKAEYFIDSSSSQTIQTIQHQQNFVKSTKDVPDFGLLQVPVWLKLQIVNQSSNKDLVIKFDQAQLHNIDFYYLVNGSYVANQSGDARPFNSRINNYHKFIYHLDVGPHATKTYYFRIKSNLKMQMPIYLGDRESIENSNLVLNTCFGIFFGIILVMFFYNLFVYFSLKDPIYLIYVIYILVVGLVQSTFEGYTFQYLWPNNTFWSVRAFFILTALVNITGVEFIRRFLNTKIAIPRLDKVAYLIYAIYAVDIIILLLGNFHLGYQIIQGFASLVSFYLLTVSLVIARRGYRPAKFFLIAWIPLLVSIVVWILKDVGVLPYNTLTNYSITIGSALEVILLSFALADKINIFKAEKEKSQEEALRALKENERIISEQNTILEAKVTERTTELNQTNLELNKTLDNLKQAQGQLVEAEKMASLGQLTAGIAHEINNPINFVTANIKPLSRDIDMVFGAMDAIEQVGLSDAGKDEKQKQINAYKEDLDFEYLVVEIKHLLKGIKEGANRTAEIVKGLRIFSRLDQDDLIKADVNEGLESTLIIANNLLHDINVIKEYGNLPKIECYAGKLNQVFLNLISNASHAIRQKFGERKGGELLIKTTCHDENLYITIKDNGIGMDEKTQKKVFEPFFTTKDVGQGTGLGMSIAYNTIKKHHGEFQLNSAAGEGAEFTMILPLFFKIENQKEHESLTI